MKKTLLVVLACALFVCAFALSGLMAADAPADGSELAYLPSKTVIFNHSSHAALDCAACHHKWDGSSAVQKCTSAGCHDVFDKKDATVNSLYWIIHKSGQANSCLNCHKETAGADKDKKKELTGCSKSKCHP